MISFSRRTTFQLVLEGYEIKLLSCLLVSKTVITHLRLRNTCIFELLGTVYMDMEVSLN
jgi:hypothetical protein